MSLKRKVEKSRDIIKEAFEKFPAQQIAVAWTGGKDSTVLLHLVRSTIADPSYKVMFNDSTIEFPEVYDFVNQIHRKWELDLIWIRHLDTDLDAFNKAANDEEKMEIMRIAKINAINYALSRYQLKAFMSGIRWDEHEARSKEKYMSIRQTHLRIHPILHFTLEDIWDYIKTYEVPYISLYDKGYKSLGEQPYTKPVFDPHAPERAGREATKERNMKRLRKLGYW